jgi:hypothetical protein
MNTTVELAHHVVVVTDDQGHYRTECGCGWASDWYLDDDVTAEAAGVDHIEIAIGPPDALDKLMGELLDLQEDLAAIVLWLADHWSADLPAPYPSAPRFGHEGTIALAVQCPETGQLDRVAELLGEPVTHDPTYDQGDRHYRHALRSFGRVTVNAWGLAS